MSNLIKLKMIGKDLNTINGGDQAYHILRAASHKNSARKTKKIKRVVLHETAGKARKEALLASGGYIGLEEWMTRAKYSEDQKIRLRASIGGRPLPGALITCLRTAADPKREASWDFQISDAPLSYYDKKVVIVQYNEDIEANYSWHAGQSEKYYNEHASGKTITNDEGVVVWDGKKFVYPGDQNNAHSIGIEFTSWAWIEKKEDGSLWWDGDGPNRPGKPHNVTNDLFGTPKIVPAGKRFAENYHPQAKQALFDLCLALCRKYDIDPDNIISHKHVDPLRRGDPTLPGIRDEVRSYVKDHLNDLDVPPAKEEPVLEPAGPSFADRFMCNR